MGTATKKNYINQMKAAFYSYTLTTGGSCTVTTGMKPIQFATVQTIDGASQHRISSSNYSAGTLKIKGTSTETGVCKIEGL